MSNNNYSRRNFIKTLGTIITAPSILKTRHVDAQVVIVQPKITEHLPLTNYKIGISAAPDVLLPIGHDYIEMRAQYEDWPTRGPEFGDQRSVVKLRAWISLDGGLSWNLLCSSWCRGVMPTLDASMGNFGFKRGSAVPQPDNPNRLLRVELVCADPLTTRVELESVFKGFSFPVGQGPRSVAYNSTSGVQTFSNANGASWSHNISSISNGFIIVHGGYLNISGGTGSALSGTHDGVSMAQLNSTYQKTVSALGYERLAAIIGLLAPNTGNKLVNVTLQSAYGALGSDAYDGVDQTTPVGAAVTTSGATGTAISQAVASNSGDMVVDGGYVSHNPGGAPSGDKTSRVNGTGSGHYGMGQDTTNASPTMGWTWVSSVAYAWVGMKIIAAGGGGAAASSRRPLTGVGP